MLEQILQTVKGQMGNQLIDKIGMSSGETEKSFDVLGGSLTEIIGNESQGGGLSTLLNLFSDNDNSSESNSLMEKFGSSLVGDLVSKAGLTKTKASGFKDLVLPLVIKFVSKKVGGNSDILGLLLGGNGSSGSAGTVASSILKGKLGGLFNK